MAYKTRPGESQFQARQRIAREKGFESYRNYRQAPAERRASATRRLAERDSGYRSRARGAADLIARRSRQDVDTPAGRVLTTTNMRRLRSELSKLPPDAVVSVTAVVRALGVDRRRRAPGRKRGRDTGFRRVRLTFEVGDADLADADSFAELFEQLVADALDSFYAGLGDSGVAFETASFVLPLAA